MAGILKVDKYQDFNGNDIMTSDGSGTITMPSGIISGQNYPAFEAALSTNQTGIADNVITKIQFADETFDTDSCYDNVTNYRFTPTVAGKYFFYGSAACNGGTSNLRDGAMYLYKNGAELQSSYSGFEDNYLNNVTISFHGVHEANGTTDYFEAFARIDTQNSSDGQLDEGGNNFRTIFGAYRIGA